VLNSVQSDYLSVQPYEPLTYGSEQPGFVNTRKSEPFAFAWFAGLLFEHAVGFESYKDSFSNRWERLERLYPPESKQLLPE
jgi:hypothetical protein